MQTTFDNSKMKSLFSQHEAGDDVDLFLSSSFDDNESIFEAMDFQFPIFLNEDDNSKLMVLYNKHSLLQIITSFLDSDKEKQTF
jgi:hypothetical protein